MTAETAGRIADAITASGVLGCGCCATYPTPTCSCGQEAWQLDYEPCPTCGITPADYMDRATYIESLVAAVLAEGAAS